MIDFYIVAIDDDFPSQISTDFEALRSLNPPKVPIYKGTLSEKVTDLIDDVVPYDGIFYNPYGCYDPETNTYMTSKDVDDIYVTKFYSIGEESAIEWLDSLYDAYVESEYIKGNKVHSELTYD